MVEFVSIKVHMICYKKEKNLNVFLGCVSGGGGGKRWSSVCVCGGGGGGG